MIEIEEIDDLVEPVVIAAFEGWNDAADAASSVIDHLIKVWDARIIGAIDPEEFYDFQVNRPVVGLDELGHRRITWPSTQVAIASPPDLDRDVILIRGIEPNMRWRQFCAELLAACDDLGGELVITLGALLADTPHTRPIPVTGIGRVWGVSASSAPRVITSSPPRSSQAARSSAQNWRQRMFGSMPRTRITSRSRSGGDATAIWVLGQVIRRWPSSSEPTVGRFTWKS